jgi:hypothetical protein
MTLHYKKIHPPKNIDNGDVHLYLIFLFPKISKIIFQYLTKNDLDNASLMRCAFNSIQDYKLKIYYFDIERILYYSKLLKHDVKSKNTKIINLVKIIKKYKNTKNAKTTKTTKTTNNGCVDLLNFIDRIQNVKMVKCLDNIYDTMGCICNMRDLSTLKINFWNFQTILVNDRIKDHITTISKRLESIVIENPIGYEVNTLLPTLTLKNIYIKSPYKSTFSRVLIHDDMKICCQSFKCKNVIFESDHTAKSVTINIMGCKNIKMVRCTLLRVNVVHD